MASATIFHGANSGVQAANIYGNVQLHAAPGMSLKNHVLGALTNSTEERSETPPSPSSTAPPFRRDNNFVERETLLNHIKQQCAVPGSWTALVGLGGVGYAAVLAKLFQHWLTSRRKSQLAIEYAYQVRGHPPQIWIFWIHASNAARFKQSFQGIADRLKISGRRDPRADILKLVHDWLCDGKKRWILILDNADDPNFLFEAQPHSDNQSSTSNSVPSRLRDYLPQSENGSVLLTTRSKEAALAFVEQQDIIVVEPINEKEAKALLKKRMGMQDDSDDVEIGELAETLEFMPLALVQAAAYICQRMPRYTVRQYIDDFTRSERKRTSLLNHEQGQLRRDKEAKNSIIIT